MNEGIIALILQWSILCLVWMGALDRTLHHVKLSRRSTLAGLAAFMLCSFADWRLYFLSVEINLSGTVLPLLLAGRVWRSIGRANRAYVLAAAALCLALLFFVRKVLFMDPVLLLIDEWLLVPGLLMLIMLLLTRHQADQLLIMLLAFPLSDALYTLSFLGYATELVIGAPAAQDLLWCSFAMWVCITSVWLASRSRLTTVAFFQVPWFRWRTKPPSER
ncbi:hypothetical protein LOK74_10040 [Brevibacillus humidisoli]|uniref:YphA family membrane protein n=1 Tax=Brevibacillus humidisoli TaxID=2895522 RepID=UPI001E387020|nr:hypothetical protein [Brevibacillus humidisoli]UFJ42802.1 hypothetical protein LOK74_10040 [Brevibacillus humidisoli]